MKYKYFFILPMMLYCLCGCGNLSSGINAHNLSNQGTITGKIYDYNKSNFYALKLIPVANAKVRAGSAQTTSNVDGSFTLSGVPSGIIAVTASAEGLVSQTILTNRNTINVYLLGGTADNETGSAVISGSVYGLPAGIDSILGSANSILKSSSAFSYNASFYTYSINNAPDDGDTYIFAHYSSEEAGSFRNIYTYYKTNMAANISKELNLDFVSSNASLKIDIDLPQDYGYAAVGLDIFDGYRRLQSVYSNTLTQETSLNISLLPQLLSGNSFAANVTAIKMTSAEVFMKIKYKYNISANEQVSISLADIPDPSLKSPENNATLSDYPVFSWEAASDDLVMYIITLSSTDTHSTIWQGITKENSIALPPEYDLALGDYSWQVAAAKYFNLDIADLGGTMGSSYIEWVVLTNTRSFTYEK